MKTTLKIVGILVVVLLVVIGGAFLPCRKYCPPTSCQEQNHAR